MCAWDVGQQTAKLVPSTLHGPIESGRTPVRTSGISENPGIRLYLNGHHMQLRVERRFGALLPDSSRTPGGANPVEMLSSCLWQAWGGAWRLLVHSLIGRRGNQVCNVGIPTCRLSLDARQTIWSGAITLRALSAIVFLHSPGVVHVAQPPEQLRRHALTLVLRSTHSSQLSVGLLRFCFFLSGISRPCALPSGLVDGCASYSMSENSACKRATPLRSRLLQCDTSLGVAWIARGASCEMSGIKGVDGSVLFPPPQPRTRMSRRLRRSHRLGTVRQEGQGLELTNLRLVGNSSTNAELH
jgi:hypothetical protein